MYSAFGVVRTTVAGPGLAEQDALERVQARRVEVLDHLDHRRGVEADQPSVAIGQRAVQQLDPLALAVGAGARAAAAGRDLERAV